METLITVKTFTYPIELAVVRGRLESEGVECFIQDEMMAQVNPFYSNAIGGIKLQVKRSDIEKAIEILKENGNIEDVNYLAGEESQTSKLFSNLENLTLKIPLINKLRIELRVFILASIIVILISILIVIAITL